MRCGDCAHWDRFVKTWDWEVSDHREWIRDGYLEHGECRALTNAAVNKSDPAFLFVSAEGGCVGAEMITRSEFGCTLFKAK